MVVEDVQLLHAFYLTAVDDLRWFDPKESLRKMGLGEWVIEDGKPEFKLTAEGRRLRYEKVT